jgi:hypothetical protein
MYQRTSSLVFCEAMAHEGTRAYSERFDLLHRREASHPLQRVADDLYQDQWTGGYVQTRYCYVNAYGEDALVLQDRVIFVDHRESCERNSF